MSPTSLDDLGKLILRLTVGILLLFHGIAKVLHGVAPIEGMVVAHGLPAFFAWGVYVGEVIVPVLLILGVYTRLGGLLAAVNIVVAIALAHSTQLFQLGGGGGLKLELQALFLFGSVAIALLGAGRYSISGKAGTLN